MFLALLSLSCCVSVGDSRSLPRHDSKDRDGQSSPVSSRMGRSSVSPTMMLSGGGGGGGGGESVNNNTTGIYRGHQAYVSYQDNDRKLGFCSSMFSMKD